MKDKKIIILLIDMVLVLGIIAILLPNPFPGLLRKVYCSRVIDGDTIIYTEPGLFHLSYRARLLYIDAPESDQLSFDHLKIGKAATIFLKNLIEGKTITVQVAGNDMYGRQLIQIWDQNIDINYEMVRSGWAVIYPFSEFSSPAHKMQYLRTYYRAQLLRRGLWSSSGLLSPYKFRKQKRLKKR